MKTIQAADLFCGAGGTSTGLLEAAASLNLDVNLLAVNHWPVAIETHSRNHQLVKHMCETLDSVDPRKVVPGGALRLLVASPECTHHSNARGGRPMNDQSRASAWHVIRWAEALIIDDILVENVKEWRSWGPLGKTGRPIKSQRGETFQAWVRALESLNYRVEYRVINSADLGAVTTRERLYVRARRGRRTIVWPRQTHSRDPKVCEALGLKRWRAAREILDWSDPGTSIFDRKKPLSINTILRICAGLRKFSGIELEPFLVKLYGTSDAASVDQPIPTVTGLGGHLAVAQPFLLSQQSGGSPRSVEDPVQTIAAAGAISKTEPMLVQYNGTADAKGVDEPVGTLTSKTRFGLAEPFLTAHFGERDGQPPRTHDVKEPLPTVTPRGAGDLCQPFITEFHGGEGAAERVKAVDAPLPTQTTEPRFGLAQPFMLSAGGPECPARSTEEPAHTVLTRDHIAVATPFVSAAGGPEGQGREPRSVEDPLKTVLAENHQGLATPFLQPVTHQGGDRTRSVEQPLPTVTGAHRGEQAVVVPEVVTGANRYRKGHVVSAELVQYRTAEGTFKRCLLIENEHGDRALLDIRFRMLKRIELARAQGFDDSYQFAGTNEDIVKQIGNAVEKHTARRLTHSILSDKETE